MAQEQWIDQTFHAPSHEFFLGDEHVAITADLSAQGPGPCTVWLMPRTRMEANQLAILLKKASRRLESLGHGLA
jgi:hypothetical protein